MMQKNMTIVFILVLFLGFISCSAPDQRAQPNFEKLQNELQEITDAFDGEVGIYVLHLPSQKEISIKGDELFPTASLIKVPILMSLFQKIVDGQIDYQEDLMYSDTLDLYAHEDTEGVIGNFRDSAEIKLKKLAALMIYFSDNNASVWLQRIAGTEYTNSWLESNGFPKTKINSRAPEREEQRKLFGWGETTPKEMTEMLVKIYRGEIVNRDASQEMSRILGNIYWYGEALSQIPPEIQVLSKQGAINASRSEVLLVNAPSGPYAFCVITKNQTNTNWEYDNDGFVILRQVSALLWNHFEPDYDWEPSSQSIQKEWW